jgi:hypothetical protein
MRAALADDYSQDGGSAATTLFSLAAIDTQRFLVGPGFAVGVEVVLEARSSMP